MDDTPRPQRLEVRTRSGWVPLGYVRVDRLVYLIARERSAQWPIDLLRTGVAELHLPEGTVRGRATLVTEEKDRAQIVALFRTAYGAEQFARWYDHPARVLRLDLDPASFEQNLPDRTYGTWLEAEFDNIAEEYDHHILGNRMNRLLRDRSLAQLRTVFADRPHLLELGCGSGIETMSMLREGHEVLAVDVSERMLAVVRAKAEKEGMAGRLRTVRLRARDLACLSAVVGEEKFDGAYSTYGALNCEPDLRPPLDAFAKFLPPGAPLVLGIYNRWCLFELVGYSLSLQGNRAFGRRRNPVRVGTSRFCIDVYAFTVGDFDRLLVPSFERVRVEGVPALLPPSDLTSYSERFARHFDQLAALDARIGRHWPLNRLGDHFLATYRRRDSTGPSEPRGAAS
ncbi:MAG: methyltransferase domain-containing protein [Thermoplasmata archaeon]|nr:methyltransferase domain-containing protein [Thermoplasmata archaeon]